MHLTHDFFFQVSAGEGSAVCTVVCMASQDACKANSVVYIAPAHCSFVQVCARGGGG